MQRPAARSSIRRLWRGIGVGMDRTCGCNTCARMDRQDGSRLTPFGRDGSRMSDLPESVLRWARYQRELGLDEVALDVPLPVRAAPAIAPKAATKSQLPPRNAPQAPPPPTFERPPPRAATPAPRAPAPRAQTPHSPAPAARPSALAVPVRTAIPTFQSAHELSAHAPP